MAVSWSWIRMNQDESGWIRIILLHLSAVLQDQRVAEFDTAQVSCSDAGLGLAGARAPPRASNFCWAVERSARSTTRSMFVPDVESQFTHSFTRTPGFFDGHLAEKDEVMQHHTTCSSVWRHVEANLDILTLLTKTHLTDNGQICSKKIETWEDASLSCTPLVATFLLAQDLQKPSEPGLNGCMKCSWFHCQHISTWCDVCHHMPHVDTCLMHFASF